MRLARWLATAVGVGGMALAAPAAAAPLRALRPVTLSGPVPALASCQLNGDDNTPRVVVDQHNKRHLVVTYLTGDDRAAVAASSFDAGHTWSRSALPGLTPCTGGPPGQLVDPGLAFTPAGTLVAGAGWVASNPPPGARNHEAIREYVSRSADGRTWSAPVDLEPSQPDQRSFFAPAPNRAMLVETERAPFLAPAGYTFADPADVVVSRSDDGGATWGSPVIAGAWTSGKDALAGGLMVAPGGGVVALRAVVDLPGAAAALAAGGPLPVTLRATRSSDGGHSFAHDVQVAACGSCTLIDSTSAPDGALLVAFSDLHPDGSSDLDLARSTDGGASWTQTRITHAPRGIPLVAVAARKGQIAVLAEQSVDGSGDPVNAVLWTSMDGGRTWTSLILGGPYQRSTISYQHFDGQLGPEHGLIALPDGFGAAFTILAPAKLMDGEQDVVYVGATDHTTPQHTQRPRRRSKARHHRRPK